MVDQEVLDNQLKSDRFPFPSEGDFTNEGKQYQAGTSLHFKAGKAHGPHSTKNGCKLLVLWTERTSKEAADLSDFILATQAA